MASLKFNVGWPGGHLARVTCCNDVGFMHIPGTLHGRLTAPKACLIFLQPSSLRGLETPYAERQMPIYEYECQACEHRFELWQKMSDKPVRVCPKCKARKVEKLISHTSFQLKGGGWYSDLYASQKPTAAAGASASGGDKPAVTTTSDASASTSKTTENKGKKGAAKAAA